MCKRTHTYVPLVVIRESGCERRRPKESKAGLSCCLDRGQQS